MALWLCNVENQSLIPFAPEPFQIMAGTLRSVLAGQLGDLWKEPLFYLKPIHNPTMTRPVQYKTVEYIMQQNYYETVTKKPHKRFFDSL